MPGEGFWQRPHRDREISGFILEDLNFSLESQACGHKSGPGLAQAVQFLKKHQAKTHLTCASKDRVRARGSNAQSSEGRLRFCFKTMFVKSAQ